MIGFKVIDTEAGEVKSPIGYSVEYDGTLCIGKSLALSKHKAVPSITIDGFEGTEGMVLKVDEGFDKPYIKYYVIKFKEELGCFMVVTEDYPYHVRLCDFLYQYKLPNADGYDVRLETVGYVWQPEYRHLLSLLDTN